MSNYEEEKLSHVSVSGTPQMVSVGHKNPSKRVATAQAEVQLPLEVQVRLKKGDLSTSKGPVFQTAITAGIMAAKRTSDLIPMCHPVGLDNCEISIKLNESGNAVLRCSVSVEHKTGVEMEALTGVTVAALTIYDMCKGLSQKIKIMNVMLLEKKGGKQDYAVEI